MSKTIYLLLLLALRFGAQAQPAVASVAAAGKTVPPPSLTNIPDCTDPRGPAVSEVLDDGFVLYLEGALLPRAPVRQPIHHPQQQASIIQRGVQPI